MLEPYTDIGSPDVRFRVLTKTVSRALFIISTGRTGTTFFASLFRKLGARSFHEPGPRWLRFASNAYASGNMNDERARRIIETRRLPIVVQSSVPYVEASCFLYGMVRPILETIDDAHVVHVVRDPRSFVRSGMNWGMYRFGGRLLNWIPYRRLAEPHFGGRFSVARRLRWAMKGQFDRLCWAWAHLNAAARAQGAGSDRFETIRYEDIFDQEREYGGLQRICTLAGFELNFNALRSVASRPVNAARKRSFPEWPNWSSAQLRELQRQCGDEASRYGYDLATEVSEVLTRRERCSNGAVKAS